MRRAIYHDAATNLLTRALNHVVQYITTEGPTLFLFNPDLRPQNGVVEVEIDTKRSLMDPATGRPVPVDVVLDHPDGWRRVRFLATGVPGLGYKAYALDRESGAVPGANRSQATAVEIESRFYRLSLRPRRLGAITHLIDKELKRDLVDPNAPGTGSTSWFTRRGAEVTSASFAICFPTRRPSWTSLGKAARACLKMSGPLWASASASARRPRTYRSSNPEIMIYDDLKRIDIRDHIRKDDIRAKEAIYFAFPFRTSPSRFLYQVHNAWARPNEDQLPGACREWFTTQNLVVSRDDGVTIALSTPDIPLVTLTDINRGRWPQHLDLTNGHVFSYLTNNYWSMNIKASQSGDLNVRYSITSRQDLDYAALAAFDSETRLGLTVYPYFDRAKAGKKALPASSASFFEIDPAAHAQVSAFKQAEDGNGYILRLRETVGRDGVAKLRSGVFHISAAMLTDGVEENRTPLAVRSGDLEIPLKANRFSTVRLSFTPMPHSVE